MPSDLSAANNLAWLLAVAPEASVRNGREALVISDRLCQATHRLQPVFLRTLAAAHAELGQFEEAVNSAEQSLRLSTEAIDRSLTEQITKQISLYRAGKPYRLSETR